MRPSSSPTARARASARSRSTRRYLINLAGSAEPFASQSREGLAYEMQRAPAYGATLVNAHIGSHRGVGRGGAAAHRRQRARRPGRRRRRSVRLVLENSSGGGDMLGSRIEELAAILEAVGRRPARAAGLLPRHRAPVGCRLRHLDGGGGRRRWSTGSSADRPRSAAAGPPERLALGARARGRTGTSTSGRGRSVRPGWGHSCGIRACRRPRSSWRRRAPTRAGTRSTCAARGLLWSGADRAADPAARRRFARTERSTRMGRARPSASAAVGVAVRPSCEPLVSSRTRRARTAM